MVSEDTVVMMTLHIDMQSGLPQPKGIVLIITCGFSDLHACLDQSRVIITGIIKSFSSSYVPLYSYTSVFALLFVIIYCLLF